MAEDDLPFAEESSTPLSDRDRDRFSGSLGKPAGPDGGSEEGGRPPQGPPFGFVVMDWVVEPFGKHHERAGFSCGKPALDDFIRARVSQYEKRRPGKDLRGCSEGRKNVLGYYTLAAGSVSVEHLPPSASRKLPKHPVPVILLARLAVDQSAQGMGLGEGLLLDALQRSLDLSAGLGVYAVEVKAIDDAAAKFYRKYAFAPLLDDPLHLFLPISTVESQLG